MTKLTLDLTPEAYHDPLLLRKAVASKMRRPIDSIGEVRILHRTLDCRHSPIYHVEVETSYPDRHLSDIPPTPLLSVPRSDAPTVGVIGAGPAGLFAALQLLQHGLRPLIIERGKPVEQRKYDIARITRDKLVDPDSNWCFGEGGAGTYSDGKLYTRSTKRGDVGAVLRTFVAHGADPDIMLDSHAHIGTDRLSSIIARIRHTIEQYGGRYLFGTRLCDILVRDGHAVGIVDAHGNTIDLDAIILATGHSARDIFHLFSSHGWTLEAKPFALGVRVEHPQQLINEIQYHGPHYSSLLPPAAYSLTTQVDGHGVFSFCMCPGGVIVPAATADSQQVVNGMSNSRRNSPFANSGIAVTIDCSDISSSDPLSLLRFQQAIEQRAFQAVGGCINAPAQRLTDFLSGRNSSTIAPTGYMGETTCVPMHEVLPPFVSECLKKAFLTFDRKMHGFITQEATLLAVESRTSSPVRIPRHRDSLQHPMLQGLFPCGEGAGYAGGIVSSALDGIRCADAAANYLAPHLSPAP